MLQWKIEFHRNTSTPASLVTPFLNLSLWCVELFKQGMFVLELLCTCIRKSSLKSSSLLLPDKIINSVAKLNHYACPHKIMIYTHMLYLGINTYVYVHMIYFELVLAVNCSNKTCKTLVFWKHVWGADGSISKE